MYKAINTKDFYLAVETFTGECKGISNAYNSGFRVWRAHDMNTYAIIIYRFRIMFGVKNNYGDDAG